MRKSMIQPMTKSMTKSKKKCTIPNYIPHKTPLFPNYGKWRNEYLLHLFALYNLFKSSFENEFEDEISQKFHSEFGFNQFCVFVFKNSSKHIQS
jgi:hypothetical protein